MTNAGAVVRHLPSFWSSVTSVAATTSMACLTHISHEPNTCSSTSASTEPPPIAGLIVLNQEVPHFDTMFSKLWERCTHRVCADGGVNRLFDAVKLQGIPPTKYKPDLVKGDLDSLRDDVKAWCLEEGIPLVKEYDQDYNDFQKCLQHLMVNTDTKIVYVVGALGGRFDQTASNVSVLYKFGKSKPDMTMYLISSSSVIYLLHSGATKISGLSPTHEGPICGLLPFMSVDSVTTQGLKWNITENAMSMDYLVSSSNALTGKEVKVTTSHPLVWMTELHF